MTRKRDGTLKLRRALPVLALGAGLLFAPLLRADKSSQAPAAGDEEFFIISSIDLKKNQIVLKRPTEVTELMQVTPQTVCLNEAGKTIPLQDLRAGDTVFITFRREPGGLPIAVRIRMGYMTYSEVLRRYLHFKE